jgi:hypothetical protein
MPPVQSSPEVQLVASSQAIPSFAGFPLMHEPPRHVVSAVHGLKSSHGWPSLPGTAEHASFASSHEAIKQPPGGAQRFGVVLTHLPDWHVSATMQN